MSARREELLEAALSYAEEDEWPVFPCHIGRKDPITLHGLKDATTDRRRILTWWQHQPFNVATPTGTPASDVLDVDVRDSGSGWPAFNRLKHAGLLANARALVETRSGGLHVHFAGTDQPCGRLRDHHLDFKSLGGYVLLPPSWVDVDDNGPAGSTGGWTGDLGQGRLTGTLSVGSLIRPSHTTRLRARTTASTALRA